MAASGYTPISLYYSSTPGNQPTATNLTNGELAINIADGKLFYKNSSGTVTTYAPTPGGIVPIANGGTNTTTTPTSGAVAIGNGTAYAFTSTGTTGQFLQSNGASAPTWADSPAPKIGTLQYFSGATTTTYPGSSWLKCDGSVYTQTAYSTLYNTIGLIQNNFTWSSTSVGTTSSIYTVTYGNGIFVAGTRLGGIFTSTDGITWTSRTSGTTSSITVLLYAQNRFIAYMSVANALTSTDGTTWSLVSTNNPAPGATSSTNKIVYSTSLDKYYAVDGSITNYWTSTNGTTWSSAPLTGNIALTGTTQTITYGNGLFVIAGQSGGATSPFMATSTDGVTWTGSISATTITNNIVWGVGYHVASNTYVAVGSQGYIRTSKDGLNWSFASSPTASSIFGILNVGANLYYYGSNGLTGYSVDSIVWTPLPILTSSDVLGMANSSNAVVTVGSAGTSRYGNKFTFNSATEFVVPSQQTIIASGTSQLYIKATT